MAVKKFILIIEDEIIEQELLMAYVKDYIDNSFEILVCDNGITALEMCQKYSPSILFVDINIPGLNGLSLIKTLKDFEFPGKVIITTAYNLFEYARQAITLGVEEYLLKPINERELYRSIDSCINVLEEEQQQQNSRQFLQNSIQSAYSYAEVYLVNDLISGHNPGHVLENAFLWPADGTLQVRFIRLRGLVLRENGIQNMFLSHCKELLNEKYHLLCSMIEKDIIILIQPRKPEEEVYLDTAVYFYSRLLLKDLQDCDISFLYVSDLHDTYQSLSESLSGIAEAQKKFSRYSQLYMRLPDPSALCTVKERQKLRQKWAQRLTERNISYMISMLKRVMGKEEAYWPGALLFLEALESYDEKIDLADVFNIFQCPKPFEKLEKWMMQNFSYDCVHTTESHHIAIAERVNHILSERFADHDLSEKIVAEEFGLSQAHFSRLIKKELGNSFINVLTNKRVEHAKKLLLYEPCPVREVAVRCGYHNQKYFLSVFKKKVGCTPTEYRNNNCKNIESSIL